MSLKPKKAEKNPEEKLKDFLRSTGRMIPQTPAQVDAFESRHHKKVKLPELLDDPLAIIERGYILTPPAENTETQNESPTIHRMAARNGLHLSADTLRKMDEDRKKAESQE